MQTKNHFSKMANRTGMSVQHSGAAVSFSSNSATAMGARPNGARRSNPRGRDQRMGAALLQPPSGLLAAGRPALLNSRFSRSLSVPVTPENRRHLRLMRELELAAWVAARGPQDPPRASGAKSLRRCVAQLKDEGRRETIFYALLAALGFGSVGYGLCQSGELVENWGAVTRFVQQFLGG